ncbi:MAG: DNA-directed RNA polymerase subunit beta' [Candidatus Omnitrophica bacterium]|nr:DNA-directed RNA polymerase subunit beta' [Candidatus Omnitrophota bacterium]
MEQKIENKNVEKIPNLLEIQIEPYIKFLQKDIPHEKRENLGIEQLLRKSFPVESSDRILLLEYCHYSIEDPIEDEYESMVKGITYAGRFKVRFRLTKRKKLDIEHIEKIKEQDIYLGLIPLMTDRGTFIINGIERAIVNQLQRSPGVYFKEEDIGQLTSYSARILPARGLWMELYVDNHNCLLTFLGKKKVFVTTLLKALGYSSTEIISLFYSTPGNMPAESIIKNTLEKDNIETQDKAILSIYQELRPGYPIVLKEARDFLKRMFFSQEIYDLSPAGRSQINKKLGTNIKETYLTSEDIINTIKYLLRLIEKKQGLTDDIDHLGNKRIRTSAELVKEHFYEGVLRLIHFVRERMSIIDKTFDIAPQNLLNTRIFSTVIDDFFARNQLSQFLDQTNPLSELTHKRRLTSIGEGGVKERKRAGFEVRDVHYTHFGRICPIETPEGANIGLINSLTVYGKVDNLGFLRTPYFQVKNGKINFEEVLYLSADEEDNYIVAPPDIKIDKKTDIIIPEKVEVRIKGGTIIEVGRNDIQLVGISPKQMVSLSASLIPFLEHDDSNRALMGSNMQRQSVPILRPETPLVKTGIEKYIIRDAGVAIKSRVSGRVSYVDSEKIIIEKDRKGIFPWQNQDVYVLQTFRRTNQDTCFHQKPLVHLGQKIEKEQLLTDGPAVSRTGELALGRNLIVAFMPWNGYNYEDAIILNEKLVRDDLFTSIHIEEFELTAQETELGPEEITADIPNVAESDLRNLEKDGIIRIGAEVKTGDILVGKITPKGETELTPEEKLLRVIFGEKARDVVNTSLVVPSGVSGTVVNVHKYIPSEKISEEKIQVSIKEIENESAGKKKIVKKIITQNIKSLLEKKNRTARDLTQNPETWERIHKSLPDDSIKEQIGTLIKIGRDELLKIDKERKNKETKIKKGAELELNVICKIVVDIAIKKKVSVGDKMSGRHGNKGVVSVILPEQDMPFLADGNPVDIILNPLGVPSRMNVGQILETHLGWAMKSLGYEIETPVFESIKEFEIKDLLRKAGFSGDGKSTLYDGRTGESFLQPITVGCIYMMKLIHLSDEKVHARAVGSYSLITQQPLGGRAQFGGQRFGEMEVWALEGYGAAHTLKEILTVKSDDTKGRKKVYESIVKGLDYREDNIPESFRVLTKELNGLGFDLRIEKSKIIGRESVSIKIASPMVIRSWSYGEVKKAETLNYRTVKPERDGLFCERIFGPEKDWECACGKYKKQRFKGVICDRCGVEVTTHDVRRERMGHIELATPVSYIWLFKSSSNWMGALLEMSQNALEMVLYYERYIVIDSGGTPLKEKELLTEEEYRDGLTKYGNKFRAGIGAFAIGELFKKIDIKKELDRIKDVLNREGSKDGPIKKGMIKKLRMLEGLLKTQTKPEYLVTSIIPVIPPDLRPLLPLDGGRFVASDLNDLYQRIINRNNRLKKLIKIQAPDIIIRNEKRMLQEAVDSLFDNGKHGAPILGKGKRPLKSLSEAVRGKQGRFRQNLLGKRVDYSGRAVIVVGPELKLNECGLPKQMALELFSPFVLRELRKKEYFHTLGSAKRSLDENREEIWAILEKITREHAVLLNRQPTLHRLSIQAFEPRLIEGNVIKVHPLVCPAFNADFDGDTMAVHIPLTLEAQIETNLLMKANTHILSPSNGKPIITPTRDVVLGCYYLTFISDEEEYSKTLSGFDEVRLLFWNKGVELHRSIKVKNEIDQIISTTVGRILFNEVLPSNIPYQNKLINYEVLEGLVNRIFSDIGYEECAIFLDKVKSLGFLYSTMGGLSIGIDDIKIPEIKEKIIDEGNKEIVQIEKEYKDGLISDGERYNRIIDVWTSITNEVTEQVFTTLRKDTSVNPFRINALVTMVDSGSRGNRSQVNQLAGMRGLMIRPTKRLTGGLGEIIETPIISNFREGLSVLEYFISIHGGRKGLVDTALKTSDAGYLSRRLIDVAHSVIVSEKDCGTVNYVLISALTDGEKVIVPLEERIIGRTAFDNIVDIISDEIIVKAGEIIDEEKAKKIVDAGITKIRMRSIFTCKAEKGVCSKCYGWDLSRKKIVNIGEAVGVIAAQSIGEPGTQLTLRTFHLGGTATRAAGPARIVSSVDGTVHYDNIRSVVNRDGKKIVLSREADLLIIDKKGRELTREQIKVGYILRVEDGDKVKKGHVLASWDPYTIPVIVDRPGKIKFKDIMPGRTVKEDFDPAIKIIKRVVIEHREEVEPQIIIEDSTKKVINNFTLSVGANILVEDGQNVKTGDIIAKYPRVVGRVQDITGGLPRVSELFEARSPKDPAILSEIDGKVEIMPGERGLRVIKIISEVIDKKNNKTEKIYNIPYGKHLLVTGDDYVIAGSKITDGPVVLSDILRIQGEKKVQEYLLNEVQKVYRIEGVTLNDKHIEIIIRQMLSKVRVIDPGNTYLLEGENMDKIKIQQINEALPKGKKSATYEPLVLGMTRVALGSGSFISAASFQETVKIITNAAILGYEDNLEGLKENVILGKVIPAGTGFWERTKKEPGEETDKPLVLQK